MTLTQATWIHSFGRMEHGHWRTGPAVAKRENDPGRPQAPSHETKMVPETNKSPAGEVRAQWREAKSPTRNRPATRSQKLSHRITTLCCKDQKHAAIGDDVCLLYIYIYYIEIA